MTKAQREEVKEMLHEVIDPWQKERDKTDKLVNIALNNIDSHLDKINGKVAEHDKVITIHLPHNISHCIQREGMDKLKENMISGKAVRNAIYMGLAASAALFSILFIIYKLVIEK